MTPSGLADGFLASSSEGGDGSSRVEDAPVPMAVADAPPASSCRYLPLIIRAEYDSPVDALVALTVPRDEALDLVVASWGLGSDLILARIDGGRCVAAAASDGGRWLACNAFPEPPCHSRLAAEHYLQRLLKGPRRGCVVRLDAPAVIRYTLGDAV
ncbi:hypothetical protein GH865_04160 [Rhodocyclus tenuis]|uniref:Uncharacterized protein n=1 Tax=Rhodocyclus tenuis TaxID=1066 RepID=A0A6L5JZ62_RHOTE|nr:hypothetical protein [Rhodocyclus gracilis]MQY52122.1 hypothetical protein [Rhodocyclus gracilis]MRD72448.1 hypothetical protein [Rhodocyclus gracilis]